MKCIGFVNGNKKSDDSEYCWIYYTQEKTNVTGVECDKIFFRSHQTISIGDEFEFNFHKGNDGKYYPSSIKIVK